MAHHTPKQNTNHASCNPTMRVVIVTRFNPPASVHAPYAPHAMPMPPEHRCAIHDILLTVPLALCHILSALNPPSRPAPVLWFTHLPAPRTQVQLPHTTTHGSVTCNLHAVPCCYHHMHAAQPLTSKGSSQVWVSTPNASTLTPFSVGSTF